MDELDHLGWVVERTVGVGRYLAGLRTNDPAMGEWLDDVLASYLVDDEADPYWSVLRANGAGARLSRSRQFNVLYQESVQLVRELSLAPVVMALLGELESLQLPDRDDALYLNASIIDVLGVSVLVPGVLVPYLASSGRAAERAGITLPLDTFVAVDLGSGEITPVRPVLGLADDFEAAASEEDGDRRLSREHVRPTAKVDLVCSIGLEEAALTEVSPTTAVYRLASHASNMQRVGTAGLDALWRVVDGARVIEVRSTSVVDTFESLRMAAGSEPAAAAPS